MPALTGIHHVTALSGQPQPNVNFYAGLLGLRLVKRTVNFDDPGTYHLYFGDDRGRPGTLLTFFPYGDLPRGRVGNGQVGMTSLAIPEAALPYWSNRLRESGLPVTGPSSRFEETVLSIQDPDGLPLELVAVPEPLLAPAGDWTPDAHSPVPVEHAIRGVHTVTLNEENASPTLDLLTRSLGLTLTRRDGERSRYQFDNGGSGRFLDLLVQPDAPRGRSGSGTVHHVAFRTPDDASQSAWRQSLAGAGHPTTPVMDRDYFRSIYFREPGGVLFEIATDIPGFATDEPADSLGLSLRVPRWLAPQQAAIERRLPPLQLPRRAGKELS